jgi:hypothetical protein
VLLADLSHLDSHLFAELLLNCRPKSLDRVELAAVGWKVSNSKVITKQCIDQSAVVSAVIVQHKMWAICFVTEAGYDISQELLEGDSVG